MASSDQIKTRFAPSPTGFLHVGGLRTALFNFLFAKKNKGTFVLRIEDTDKSREVEGAADHIQEMLKNFGLTWDEGPFFQSQRLKIYQERAEELIEKKVAYRCYCSEKRLATLREEAKKEKQPFKYDKHCLKNEESGETFVIRQNITEEGSTRFDDRVYGTIEIKNSTLDDSVLIKSDGYPTYNFANVIDDHLMDITHVLRGEEFISSTPKHILLYEAFGWTPPVFAHLPLILDTNRKKLSKRTGDVAVEAYLEKGYLKEALVNFIALLGWNPKTEQELFSMDELIKSFAIEKINKAGAIFDLEKLDYINREWQKRLQLDSDDPLYRRAQDIMTRDAVPIDPALFTYIWPLVLERVKGPSDLEEKLPEFYFFFQEPEYDVQMLIWKNTDRETIRKNLEKIYSHIASNLHTPQTSLDIEKDIKNLLEKEGIATGEALWPMRVALSGLEKSPSPFEITSVFSHTEEGRQIILNRLKKAIDILS